MGYNDQIMLYPCLCKGGKKLDLL